MGIESIFAYADDIIVAGKFKFEMLVSLATEFGFKNNRSKFAIFDGELENY